MGYQSDVIIAVSKELYVKCQLLGNIPKAIQEIKEVVTTAEVVYWFIDGWKWYDSYPEIQEIEAWFEWCADEEENPPIFSNDSNFGAIRLGEGDGYDRLDVQTWGNPDVFDLWVSSCITCPVDHP